MPTLADSWRLKKDIRKLIPKRKLNNRRKESYTVTTPKERKRRTPAKKKSCRKRRTASSRLKLKDSRKTKEESKKCSRS